MGSQISKVIKLLFNLREFTKPEELFNLDSLVRYKGQMKKP